MRQKALIAVQIIIPEFLLNCKASPLLFRFFVRLPILFDTKKPSRCIGRAEGIDQQKALSQLRAAVMMAIL